MGRGSVKKRKQVLIEIEESTSSEEDYVLEEEEEDEELKCDVDIDNEEKGKLLEEETNEDEDEDKEEEEEDDEEPFEIPESFAWIKDGMKLLVVEGLQNYPYPAQTVSDPFCDEDGDWMVTVRWESHRTIESVECSRCENPNALGQEHEDEDEALAAPAGGEQPRRLRSAAAGGEQPRRRRSAAAGGEQPRRRRSTRVIRNKEIQEALERKRAAEEEASAAAESSQTTPRKKRAVGTSAIVTPDRSDEDYDNEMAKKPAAAAAKKNNKNQQQQKKISLEEQQFDEAKINLCAMPGVSEQMVLDALKVIGPPYGLQAAMLEIEKKRDTPTWSEPIQFEVKLGMRVRKMFEGRAYYGKVTKEAELVYPPSPTGEETQAILDDEDGDGGIMMWEVTFDDGDKDDMPFDELLRCRADRPLITAPCRGRPMQCLELFSGRGVVTQEFAERKWRVASYDSWEYSNATHRMDVLEMEPSDLPFVPDFIWASPPCTTYTNLTGGLHRKPREGLLEKTAQAREQNFLFQKMTQFMYDAKARHPHLIVAIENPRGSLQEMPLMKEFITQFGLFRAQVDYCAFGRPYKKPTMIWTNDFVLKCNLEEYQCTKKCVYGRGRHPVAVARDYNKHDFAMIPQPLAEEVAEYVHAKFVQDRIRHKPAASPGGNYFGDR